MLLEVSAHKFLAGWLGVFFLKAAKTVNSIGLDSFIVQGESADENSHLKDEISNDSKTSYQAEVLKGWDISKHADEESKSFA
jgi:hypothetical protein